MKKFLTAAALLFAMVLPGCHTVDNDRIPPAPVHLVFQSVADWNVYGTPAATSWRLFVKNEHIPANFSYTAVSETGFGGILLCGDIFGAPAAYDAACPVEARADVRVTVDDEALVARCPVCGSTYDIFSNYGSPLSGRAASLGYGLQRYYVGAGPAGEYMIVVRR